MFIVVIAYKCSRIILLLIFKNELIYKIKHRDIGFTLLNAHYNNSQQITIFAPLKY